MQETKERAPINFWLPLAIGTAGVLLLLAWIFQFPW